MSTLPAPAGVEVAVLVHDRRHGVDVRVFASYDAAVHARADLARHGWSVLAALVDGLPARPPADDAHAGDLYFAHHRDEDASIRVLPVAPDPAAQSAP